MIFYLYCTSQRGQGFIKNVLVFSCHVVVVVVVVVDSFFVPDFSLFHCNFVRTGLPVGVGIGSLPVTPNRNGEISVLCVESGLAGVPQHNKNMINEMNE